MTETCFSKSPRSGIISVLLTIPSQKPISFSILVKIVGEADTTPRPTIAIGQAISVIPYADIPLTLKHIQLLDTGVDPTKVYLYSPSRRFHWKHSCNATATIFSFFNIIHEDIIYHHTDDMSPITLNLVNLNNLDVEFNADQIEHFVESIIPLTESSPLLQYLRADCPDHITSDEIHLQLSIDELYTHVVSSKSPFVRAPSPEELTRVRPGEMGFILTPKHLLMPSGSALYSLDSSMSGGRVIIDMTSGNLITHFTQEDVNRLRLALVVISNPLHTGVTFVGHRPARMETAVEVKLSVTTPESGAIRNAT
ncbi:unnamed protein product [Mesocestoides corti]|uniref:Uncharacterized protein n=1 Tax=Mesocestoides corti TaxID=53468 RepID=A0A0R3UD61_MESCO|nr:unnamed protein product [Mesocestoides corti]